jgi:hypothetical protein
MLVTYQLLDALQGLKQIVTNPEFLQSFCHVFYTCTGATRKAEAEEILPQAATNELTIELLDLIAAERKDLTAFASF